MPLPFLWRECYAVFPDWLLGRRDVRRTRHGSSLCTAQGVGI